MKTYFTFNFLLLFLLVYTGNAQSLVDGFTQEKGGLSVAVSYNHESYDQFYMGTNKVDLSVTGLKKIITQSVNLYAEYGLSDKVGLVVNLPYISAKSDVLGENNTVSEKSIQNGAVVLEWKAAEQAGDAGTFSLIAALGLTLPLSGYATNVIYAIGNHATSLDPKLVFQYKLNNGLFAQAQGGYSLRNNKVPNAVLLSAKIGYAGAHFYVDGWLAQQWSAGGIDIGAPGFSPERFPETKVNTTNLGLSAYVPLGSSFGLTAGTGTRLSGRNAGLPSWYTLGLALHLGQE